MKTLTTLAGIFLLAAVLIMPQSGLCQPSFPGGSNPDIMLDQWSFSSNNWYSDYGRAPVAFTNIADLTNILWIDTADSSPAYLFYNVVETNGSTNILCSNGTISLWLNPDWTSVDQGGTGPQDWANLISLGEYGTNGSSWWAWYFEPNGTNIYFSAQTNGTDATNYLSAPISLVSGTWYNLVLTYTPTNSAFYTNGVLVTNGTGVDYWPGPDVTFFAMGSDSNGYHQAESLISLVDTYNYPLDPSTIADNFGMMSIFYGYPGTVTNQTKARQAPSSPSIVPVFDAVTGLGFLQTNTFTGSCFVSNQVLISGMSATVTNIGTNTIVNYSFSITGGSNGYNYDVFYTPVLQYPITNSTWYWMGQGPHCMAYTLPITNSPNPTGYFILGTPQDSDGDGLTDAYERLVTHTDPHNAYSNGSGMADGWSVVYGLNPLVNSTTNSGYLSTYFYDPVGRLDSIAGIRSETLTNDAQGNVVFAH